MALMVPGTSALSSWLLEAFVEMSGARGKCDYLDYDFEELTLLHYANESPSSTCMHEIRYKSAANRAIHVSSCICSITLPSSFAMTPDAGIGIAWDIHGNF